MNLPIVARYTDRTRGRRGGRRSGRVFLPLPVIALAAWMVGCLAAGVFAQESVNLGERWSGVLPAGASAVLHADLTGDGTEELVVAVQQQLRVYRWDANLADYVLSDEIGGLPAPVSALAVGDVLPGGGRALLVGTAGSGVIRVYRVAGGLELLATVGRLWAKVTEILPVDLDGDGLRDVVARNENGDVVVFRQERSGEFREAWRTPAGSAPMHFVAVGDLTGDGIAEMVVATEYDGIQVYGWIDSADAAGSGRLHLLYEAFPWGRLQALDLADWTGNGRFEVLLVTDAVGLYVYGVRQGSFELIGVFEALPLVAARDAQILRAFPPDRPLWIAMTGDGVAVWEYAGAAWHLRWEVPVPLVAVVQSPTGSIGLWTADGALHIVEPAVSGALRIVRQGEAYTPSHPVLWEDGHVWLAAEDWRELIGSSISWITRGGTRWTGVAAGFQFFVVDAGSAEVTVNGWKRMMPVPARFEDDLLYVPVAFLELLDIPHTYSPALRRLTLD